MSATVINYAILHFNPSGIRILFKAAKKCTAADTIYYIRYTE
jgi:hypothetical protein